jgi:hypothetical protein
MSDYNGWTNYPTWAVNLWLANDQGLQSFVVESLSECAGETRRIDSADWLKGFVRGYMESDEASMASDLLGYALDCVDWYEIATSWLEQIDDERGEAA